MNNQNQIKQHDMKVGTVAFMIFCICAAGAYGIEAMIPASGPGLTLVLLMVIPFVWALPMGLATVELGAARPVEGGYYKWIQEALGEFWGFQAGWWKTIANYLDGATYVILAGSYAGYVIGLTDTTRYLFQVVIILIVMGINLRGIKESGRVTSVIGVTILAVFVLITIVGFLNAKYNPFEPFLPTNTDIFTSLGGGLAIGIWLYSGYEAMSAISGEVKNPKTIPKATMIAIPMIALTYILPTMAGLSSVGQWENWVEGVDGNSVGYGTVLIDFLGSGWGVIFGIVAILSAISIYINWMGAGTRVLFAMADDNLGPKFCNKVNKKGVPWVPIVIMGGVSLLLGSFDFSVVLTMTVLMIIAMQVLLFITMIVMRYKKPEMERPIKIPGPQGLINVFFSIPIVVGVIAYLLNGTDYFLGGLIGLATGPIAYFYFKRRYKGMSVSDPVNYPINPKTKLGVGDMKSYSICFVVIAILAVMGALFLPIYEGSWGPEYYMDTWGVEFNSLIMVIWISAAVSAILAIILAFVAKKVEVPVKK